VEGYDQDSFISTYMDETFFPAKPGFRWRREETQLSLLNFPAGCNMAFRRQALEKINYFDERINHGFDDLDPVEKLGSRGFKIVLDPEVTVYHQHRTRLKEMLKQHFNYGRGGTLMIIVKRASKLAQWFKTYLISSTFVLTMLILLFTGGFILNSMRPIHLGLNFIVFSIALLMTLYLETAFRTGSLIALLMTLYLETAFRTGSLRKLILYPILDIARGIFFTLGGITKLFKEMGRKTRQNL